MSPALSAWPRAIGPILITRSPTEIAASNAVISIVIPTIKGREHYLERCLVSYALTTEDYETIILHDRPTCSMAWNEGMAEVKGEFVQFSADDIEPHPGWWQAAIDTAQHGKIPCADLVDPAGNLTHCGDGEVALPDGQQTTIARVPFMPSGLARVICPVMENQYMSDYWISWRAAQLGWPTVVVRAYLFTHHHALEGRLYTLDQDAADYYRIISGD